MEWSCWDKAEPSGSQKNTFSAGVGTPVKLDFFSFVYLIQVVFWGKVVIKLNVFVTQIHPKTAAQEYTYTHAHARTRAHKHTHTHTNTHTHTHTHTYTHTQTIS